MELKAVVAWLGTGFIRETEGLLTGAMAETSPQEWEGWVSPWLLACRLLQVAEGPLAPCLPPRGLFVGLGSRAAPGITRVAFIFPPPLLEETA